MAEGTLPGRGSHGREESQCRGPPCAAAAPHKSIPTHTWTDNHPRPDPYTYGGGGRIWYDGWPVSAMTNSCVIQKYGFITITIIWWKLAFIIMMVMMMMKEIVY